MPVSAKSGARAVGSGRVGAQQGRVPRRVPMATRPVTLKRAHANKCSKKQLFRSRARTRVP